MISVSHRTPIRFHPKVHRIDRICLHNGLRVSMKNDLE